MDAEVQNSKPMRALAKFNGIIPLMGAAVLTALCGCSHSSADSREQPASPAVSVPVVHPNTGEITRSITLPGNVLAYQQATLYAKVAGYLKKIAVDKGDAVKEGALLAEIEVPEMLADLVKAKVELEVAALDHKRVGEAAKKAPDLVIAQSVDNAKGKYDIAKANLERLEILLGYARITAPFSGVITKRMVDPGAFIPAATSGSAAQNAALVTLTDFSSVRVQVAVPELEVPFIIKGLPAKVTIEELPGRAFDATVTRYAYALDELTKTMLTEMEIPNPKSELRPGMYPNVKLVVERKNALLLPVETLVVEKTKTSVFTVVDGKARKVALKTGFNDGVSVELLEGIDSSAAVILVGKQTISDGQMVQVVEGK
jgi:membrane fusion protein (multidrug efflux system)